jgi:hypothetical protein
VPLGVSVLLARARQLPLSPQGAPLAPHSCARLCSALTIGLRRLCSQFYYRVLAPGFTFRVPGFGRERLLNKEEFFELIFQASPAMTPCLPPI